MIAISFILLGFALLLLQQAVMSLQAEWDEWTQVFRKGIYGSFQGRYRPHPRFRVVSH